MANVHAEMKPGLLSIVNLAVLAAAYVALVLGPGASLWYRTVVVAGAAVVVVAALLTFGRARALRGLRPRSTAIAAVLAITPWVVLTVMVVARGLWWTQRPPALRVFVLYVVANWSVWLVGGGQWQRGPRRAVSVVAYLAGAAGIQGMAFGVSPFGCAVSAALAAAASLLLVIAARADRPTAFKVFAASMASLLAVGMVEAAVRVLQIGHNVREMDSREQARTFYAMTPPNAAFVNQPHALDEFPPALVATNSLGIRGPELTERRADLLLLGDSMIEARQLPWEQTLGPQLEAALRARGHAARVVAHGMRGWSPLLEWNWYLKVGRQLRPRHVLLFFFWNDLWTAGDEATTFQARLGPDGRPQSFDVAVDGPWIWYKHVRLVRLAGDALQRLTIDQVKRAFTTVTSRAPHERLDDEAARELARRATQRPLSPEELTSILTLPVDRLDAELRVLASDDFWPRVRPVQLWTEAQRRAAASTELTLERFAEDVAADGGRLVLVYVPNPIQTGPHECSVGRLFSRVERDVVLPADTGLQQWLREVSVRHDIELLDPSGEMRAFNSGRADAATAPLHLRADCHWSAHGHRFMAELLAGWAAGSGAATR